MRVLDGLLVGCLRVLVNNDDVLVAFRAVQLSISIDHRSILVIKLCHMQIFRSILELSHKGKFQKCFFGKLFCFVLKLSATRAVVGYIEGIRVFNDSVVPVKLHKEDVLALLQTFAFDIIVSLITLHAAMDKH